MALTTAEGPSTMVILVLFAENDRAKNRAFCGFVDVKSILCRLGGYDF